MKMPARQEETRMVRARTFTGRVAEEIRVRRSLLSKSSHNASVFYRMS
jgi:hypothetical protein